VTQYFTLRRKFEPVDDTRMDEDREVEDVQTQREEGRNVEMRVGLET